MNKTCSICRAEKSLEEFAPDKKRLDGRGSWCKECKKYKNRLRYKEKQSARDYHANYAKSYRIEHADKYKNTRLKGKYGITVDQYNNMYEDQHGQCAICFKQYDNFGVLGLGVDHDHKTGKVRGLLCNTCNSALGLFGDIVTLENAILYLKSNK